MSILNSLYHAIQQIFPSFAITEPLGKWGLIGLVWLLLLFLIKPKPRKRVVPSLMFLLQRKKKSKIANLLQRLIKDPLKVLQFFIAAFFVLALFLPVYYYLHDTTAEHTTVLIDISASVKPFFSTIQHIAKEQLRGKITLIAIADQPMVLGQNLSIRTAKKMIDQLKPTDAGSAIGAALQIAQAITPKSGSIVIISDFRESTGINLRKQVRILREQGRALALYPVGIDSSAVFFTGIRYEGKLSLIIKNIGKEQTIQVYDQILQEDGTIKQEHHLQTIILPANEKKELSLSLAKGRHWLILKDTKGNILDQLPIIIPSKQDLKIHVMSNHYQGYLKNFLDATNYSITVTQPPIIPDFTDDDLVIFYQWDNSLVLTPLRDALDTYLNAGGDLLIYADHSFENSKLQQFVPFTLVKIEEKKQTAKTTPFVPFLEEPVFFTVDSYFLIGNFTNALPLMVTKNNKTLATLSNYGRGTVLWYGVFDQASSFPKTLAYPLFFDRAIKWLGKYEEFSSVNKPVGTLLKGTNITYHGKPLTDHSFLQEGFYSVDDFHVALYQANEKEYSDPAFTTPQDDRKEKKEHFLEKRAFPLVLILLSILLLLILGEVYYIKWRGDI